jgi:hypothetical protein
MGNRERQQAHAGRYRRAEAEDHRQPDTCVDQRADTEGG